MDNGCRCEIRDDVELLDLDVGGLDDELVVVVLDQVEIGMSWY